MQEVISTGDLRNRIVIEALPKQPDRNADGSEKRTTEQWKPFVKVSAKIDTKGGREFFQAKQLNATLSHEITIRHQRGITPEMRIRFDDPAAGTKRYFSIEAVVNPNNEVRHMLLLHCTELVGREVTT